MTERFKGLAHICIFTENLGKSIDFYTNSLHFALVYETTVQNESGNIHYAVVKLNDCVIELLEPEDKSNLALNRKGTIDHFALEVERLEETISRLRSQDVEFTTGIFSFEKLLNGVQGAFIKGPSGELIELFEYQNQRPF